jgi:LysM repeat protein
MSSRLLDSRTARILILAVILLGTFTLVHHSVARGQVSAQELPSAGTPQATTEETVQLPPLDVNVQAMDGIARLLTLKTLIPERPNHKVIQYAVQAGDSPWSIANQFDLQPESILWANTDLNSSAGSLKPGMVLNIPPTDGVIHTVIDGDTLESIQAMHGTTVEEIFEYPGNEFDLTETPRLITGQQVIVPNGTSPIAWQEAGPNLGVVASAGSSSIPLVMTGNGFFLWPIAPPFAITQPYWSGHYGIDLDTYPRQPVFASDGGTVIFSGWDETGYGYFIIIDHGNGYRSTYGHNTANLVSAGQGVVQGQQIAESGSTGNSTGDHLDFRILYNGTALDPAAILR